MLKIGHSKKKKQQKLDKNSRYGPDPTVSAPGNSQIIPNENILFTELAIPSECHNSIQFNIIVDY